MVAGYPSRNVRWPYRYVLRFRGSGRKDLRVFFINIIAEVIVINKLQISMVMFLLTFRRKKDCTLVYVTLCSSVNLPLKTTTAQVGPVLTRR